MEILKGIGVSSGYAIGEAFVFDREEYRVSRRRIAGKEVDGEIQRFRKACEAAEAEIVAQVEAMPRKVRDVAGSILEAQSRNLRDPHLQQESIDEIRKNSSTAEYAVSRVLKRKVKLLENSGAQVFVQRVMSELVEIEKMLLRHLTGSKREDITRLKGKAVVVAHDLSPMQTLGLDREKVLGIVTEAGGPTSHTAIVARSLGIPAVVGVEGIMGDLSGGDAVVLDGATGTVILNPDEGVIKRYQAMEQNFLFLEKKLSKELRDLPAVTKDGTRVQVFANIEAPEEIRSALDHGAEGIGLYRTEFLYLEHNFSPSEKDHLEAYRKAISLLGKRRLIIRTMDLGADKMPQDGTPREANPFLGTRAIRLCFERPDMFRTQLRAILKSAALGNVGTMVPMVSSLAEIRQVKEIVESVRRDLRREGEAAGEGIDLGIMVEVPSAAVVADQLAPHVAFFSVGTNDLIAYTKAVDRSNERVAPLYQPADPAILRLLKLVIDAGAKHGKPVSVCGEMSSDITYTLLLLGMGLRHFSVVPPAIPELKKVVRSVSLKEAEAIAAKAFTFDDARATTEFLREETRKILPDAVL